MPKLVTTKTKLILQLKLNGKQKQLPN